MTVAVLVPWRPGCPHRERAWAKVQELYAERHPDWELVTGSCADGPFNRSQGILDAARRTDAELLVVADADVWCDPGTALDPALEHGWAIPHELLHRLAQDSTDLLIREGAVIDWRRLPLSTDNRQDVRPYRGHETGTLVVLRRDVLLDVPPDPRFVGWGQEDDAWAAALRTLIGMPWRGSDDLIHLWHPAPPRLNRRFGSIENRKLYERYLHARRQPARMRILIDEAKEVARDHSAA